MLGNVSKLNQLKSAGAITQPQSRPYYKIGHSLRGMPLLKMGLKSHSKKVGSWDGLRNILDTPVD